MSWKDRDWARDTPSNPPPGCALGRPGRPRFSIVTTLIAINVVIFLLRYVSQELSDKVSWFGVLQPLVVVQGQLWRLFTAQYLHANWFHVLVNMIGLHLLGRPLEERWSARKFFAIYTLCGLFGNVFYTVLGAKLVINPLDLAVGASGSVYGLLGLVAVLCPTVELLVFFVLPVRIRTLAVILGVIAFMSVVERGENYGGQACHLAGLVFGVWWALHGDEWWSSTEWAWSRKRKE